MKEGLGFVANGSILARTDRFTDKPVSGSVPFQSPPSMEVEYHLPNTKTTVKGMLIPRGVTVVTGGGFHGKSTLLRGLATGVYNKVPGDGREFVVIDNGTVTVRAEDGRYVNGVDVSPFIGSLPRHVTCDPSRFGTSCASGSTSQAANVMESLETGVTAFLMDEDTCAANFMTRDSRMRAMIAHEPITPYIYRVNAIWTQCRVSTILAVGGCGDWFDVHTTALMMDDYLCSDVTARANSISRTFSHGRVQYNGRGLVHRLSWPWSYVCRSRYPILQSVRPLVVSEIRVREGGGLISFGSDGMYSVDLSRLLDSVPETELYVTGIAYCIQWIARQCIISSEGVTSNDSDITDKSSSSCSSSRNNDSSTTTGDTTSNTSSLCSLSEYLGQLECLLEEKGLVAVMGSAGSDNSDRDWKLAAVTPRVTDVAAAFNRVRGVTFAYKEEEKEEEVVAAVSVEIKHKKLKLDK